MTQADAIAALVYATAGYLAYCTLGGTLLGALGRWNRDKLAAAPDAFDLVWKDKGRKTTAQGERHLYEAAPTEAFAAAWRASKDALRSAGYAFTKTAAGEWAVAFWERPSADEVAAAEAAKAVAREASRATDAAVELPVPEGLSYLPYQRAGIAYAADRPATFIADEMGLGKTIQALGVANATGAKTILVICPASLKLNWSREAAKWLTTPLPVHVVKSGKAFPTLGSEGGIVIVNYDIVHKHAGAIRAQTWDLLVCDEAHALKNKRARRTAFVLGGKSGDTKIEPIRATRRLLLTGTPIGNRPVELHPLLAYLDPQTWGNFMGFAKRYCAAYQGRFGWDFSGASHLDELQAKLRETVMVRRLKADVLTELPAKMRQVVPVEAEDKATRALVAEQIAAFEAAEAAEKSAKAAMAAAQKAGDQVAYEAAVSRLRQAKGAAFTELSRLRLEVGRAKIPHVLAHLEDVDQPVVVFAHHHEVVDALVTGLRQSGRKVVTVTGAMSTEDRQASVDAFQVAGTADVIVGTLGAMSTGLTLTRSSHVVFAEQDWVPATLSQAEDRCHRIGQASSVLVQHILFDGSLDARMAQVVLAKMAIIAEALDVQAPEATPAEAPVAKAEPVVDLDALRAIEDAARAVVAEREAAKAKTDAERAERAREDAEASVEVLAKLREVLTDRGWALSPRSRELAQYLAGSTVLTRGQRDLALSIIGNVEDLLARAAARVRDGEPGEAELARAQDETVRAAALEACRRLSAADLDWASEDNGVGWSQATTHTGHWLSERDALDVDEAAYALRILRVHRRQLDDALVLTLFG